jgi:hypothetical protein
MEGEQKCSVCCKQAQYLCGHGCETAYCGESCAKSVYNVHKESCSELIEWNPFHRQQPHHRGGFAANSFSSAQEMYNHFVLQGPSFINLRQRIPPILNSLSSVPANQRNAYINMFVQAVNMVRQNHFTRYSGQDLQQLNAYNNQALQMMR